MSDTNPLRNAFSEEYRTRLQSRDEPDGPWAGDLPKPLVLWDLGGEFGLFQPWQDPRAGDEPQAVFTALEDARLALVARAAVRRTRYYQLSDPQEPRPAEGYAILREGEVRGRIRSYEPEWIEVLNVLTCTAQSSEGLATLLDLAGPTAQEDVGEILGRSFPLSLRPAKQGEAPGAEGTAVRPDPE